MKRRTLTLSSYLLCSLSAVAYGQESDPKTLYEIGKDVARLEQEVKDIKTVLKQILELDKQRVALLSQIVAGGGVAPALADAAPSASAPEPQPAASNGTVSGKVRLPGGTQIAYVYVDNVPGRIVRGRSIEIAQENRQFSPRWAVVQRGTKVRFPNKDTIYHNVFSRSPEAKFDLGVYRKGDEAKEHTFIQPGLIDVYCNMHSEMSSEILVVPNHLYTKVESDGRFTLANVPTGKRKIVVWAPGHTPTERWITVAAGTSNEVALAAGEPRKKGHLNKSGQPYGSYK